MAKADVEVLVVQWLNSIVGSGWAAHGDKPATPGDQYILVDRTGGPREGRENRETREGREQREPRENREPREAREPRENREPPG